MHVADKPDIGCNYTVVPNSPAVDDIGSSLLSHVIKLQYRYVATQLNKVLIIHRSDYNAGARGVARNLFWGYKSFWGWIKLLNSRSDVIFTP